MRCQLDGQDSSSLEITIKDSVRVGLLYFFAGIIYFYHGQNVKISVYVSAYISLGVVVNLNFYIVEEVIRVQECI